MSVRVAKTQLLLLAISILSGGIARADDIAYAIAGPQFGTINLNTGVFSLVGNTGVQLGGLGIAGGKLYAGTAVGNPSPALYQVNMANGSLTRIGSSSISYAAFGSTLYGLYASDGAGYLYNIDPVTGVATQIGTGLLPQCNGAMSTNSETLYFSCGTSLYTINVTDGKPTFIRSTGSAALNALILLNGTLYGGEYSPVAAVVSLDPFTGAFTPGPGLKGALGNFWGFAPIIPGPPPSINSGGIVPVFSSSNTIQSGSWISIYGKNFSGGANLWVGDFPTSLGGVSVTINDKPAYLWLVNPGQINLQAPDDTATGTVNVVVRNAAGMVSSTVTLSQYAPSLSLFNGKYAAAIVPTPGLPGNSGSGYDRIGPADAFSFTTRPVKAGETLLLYGVGFGPTNPAVPAGRVFSGAAPCVDLPAVRIGGVPATVSFAGIVQDGVYQLNVVVPDAGTGDQPLEASIGGASTPPGAFVTLQ
jgi:uncharacterized protein (TIGR03437 family)